MEAGTFTVSLTPRAEGRAIVAMVDPVAHKPVVAAAPRPAERADAES
jgi:hypothetical protein